VWRTNGEMCLPLSSFPRTTVKPLGQGRGSVSSPVDAVCHILGMFRSAPVRFSQRLNERTRAKGGVRVGGARSSAISNFSERMAEAGELLERTIGVVFLAAAVVTVTCAAALVAAFTFAVIHNGDDFDFGGGSGDFGNGSGGGGDIIVLPAGPF
jgi:hypothetical protein